jgi:hypothetical protein
MKPFRIAFVAALLALITGAMAQTVTGYLVVDVPFAFSANGQKLPAGHYIVKQDTGLIRIFNHGNVGLFVPTHAAYRTKSDGSKLVFHRYGDDYFLSEVWTNGSRDGKELYPSHAEREAKSKSAEMEMAVVRPAQ